MIEDFSGQAGQSFEASLDDAEKSSRARDVPGARGALVRALLHLDAPERDYTRAVRALEGIFRSTRDADSAIACIFYTKGDAGELVTEVGPVDRGRIFSLLAATGAKDGAALHARAAREFIEGGRLVRAAFACEAAHRIDEARALFGRVVDGAARREDPYVEAHARFQAARLERSPSAPDAPRSDPWLAVERFEEAAERFNAIGQRERSFDCYQMLVAIGQLTHTFEHEVEGLVNGIRILVEDDHRAHALSLFERAVGTAERAGEFVAGATIAKEHAAYAERLGLSEVARSAIGRQALLLRQAAHRAAEASAPASAVESAYLASAEAYAKIGAYSKVRDVYRALAEKGEPSRRAYYARAVERYRTDRDAPLFESEPDRDVAVDVPHVSREDLIEWEDRGNAADACADVLVDPELRPGGTARRAALVALLAAHAARRAPKSDQARALEIVAERLGPVELYRTLPPLEALAAHPSPEVRLAAVAALSRYAYKRTFVTVERALGDSDPRVLREARRAIERLRFDHAYEPLLRLFRTGADPDTRLAALRAIARLDHPGARDLVRALGRHGTDVERQTLKTVLGEPGAQPSTSFKASPTRG